MIEPSVVEEIRRLLAEKKTYGQIARAAGVGRATVGRIARGEGPYAALPGPPDEAEVEVEPEPIGPPQRCKGCGGLVTMPCILCRVRRWIARRRKAGKPRKDDGDLVLGLDLKPEHRARYEEVRAWRERAARGDLSERPPWETGSCE